MASVLKQQRRSGCKRIRRLLIADDQAIAAEGLARICSDVAETIELVVSGDQLLKSLRKMPPDLVIGESALPIVSGIDAMRVARSEGYAVPFLFLTRSADLREAASSIRWGARGYLTKTADQAEVLEAVETLLAGGIYFSSEVLTSAPCLDAGNAYGLTASQVGIIRQLGQGLRAKEIAFALGLSTRTIEHHKFLMMRRLGVHGTIELVAKAREVGVI